MLNLWMILGGKEVDEEEEGPQGGTLRNTCRNRGKKGFKGVAREVRDTSRKLGPKAARSNRVQHKESFLNLEPVYRMCEVAARRTADVHADNPLINPLTRMSLGC